MAFLKHLHKQKTILATESFSMSAIIPEGIVRWHPLLQSLVCNKVQISVEITKANCAYITLSTTLISNHKSCEFTGRKSAQVLTSSSL